MKEKLRTKKRDLWTLSETSIQEVGGKEASLSRKIFVPKLFSFNKSASVWIVRSQATGTTFFPETRWWSTEAKHLDLCLLWLTCDCECSGYATLNSVLNSEYSECWTGHSYEHLLSLYKGWCASYLEVWFKYWSWAGQFRPSYSSCAGRVCLLGITYP